MNAWSKINNLLYILLILIAFSILLFVYGLIPGQINEISAFWSLAGRSQALVNNGIMTFGFIKNIGGNLGFPFVMGLPFYYLSATISVVFDLNAYNSTLVAGILFLLAAFISMIYLMKKLSINRYIAVICSYIYFSLFINYGQARYTTLMYAFMLVPFYLLTDYLFFNYLKEKKYKIHTIAWFFLLYSTVRTVSLFFDGYSFLISLVASFFVLLTFVYDSYKSNRDLTVPKDKLHLKTNIFAAIFFFSLGNFIAIVLYKLYVPGQASYSVMSIDFFRAQGADLITFFTPGQGLLFLDWLGWTRWWNYRAFYGDGSNVLFNYLGFIIFSMYVAFLFLCRKRSFFVNGLVIAGLFSLFISLGPSLKINDTRTSYEDATHPITSDYFMPKDAATVNLHTDFIYQHIPGIKNMRVVTRWLLLFNFSMVICVAFFLTFLLRRKKYSLLTFLIILSLIELQPNIFALNSQNRANYAQFKAFELVLNSFKPYFHENDKVFFLSNENDYLVNYICSDLDIRCYNNGGDKVMELAWKYLPKEIQNMRMYKKTTPAFNVNENAAMAIAKGDLDVLVIPFFNLRWDSYKWPPSENARIENKKLMLSKFDIFDQRFSYKEEKWFGIVTYKKTN